MTITETHSTAPDTDLPSTKSYPTMERPEQIRRVRTGVRAGGRAAEGGVTHTDKWNMRW